MGNSGSVADIAKMQYNGACRCVNSEDVKRHANNSRSPYIIINTLPKNEQSVLISGTLNICDEVDEINNMMGLKSRFPKKNIIVYGKNWKDESVYSKYTQLTGLGFKVCIYVGGLFEWLCLQDMCGSDIYQTTSVEIDVFKYMPPSDNGLTNM